MHTPFGMRPDIIERTIFQDHQDSGVDKALSERHRMPVGIFPDHGLVDIMCNGILNKGYLRSNTMTIHYQVVLILI